MHASIKALLFYAYQEAIVLQTYPDSRGVLTIGVGHTAAAGGMIPHIGNKITIEEALKQFALDVAHFEADVSRTVQVPLNQWQFDAEVDFDFNTGAVGKSEAAELNRGDLAAAMATLKSYVHAGGRILPGLVARRQIEADMFLKGTYPPISFLPVFDYYPGPVRHVPIASIDLVKAFGLPGQSSPSGSAIQAVPGNPVATKPAAPVASNAGEVMMASPSSVAINRKPPPIAFPAPKQPFSLWRWLTSFLKPAPGGSRLIGDMTMFQGSKTYMSVTAIMTWLAALVSNGQIPIMPAVGAALGALALAALRHGLSTSVETILETIASGFEGSNNKLVDLIATTVDSSLKKAMADYATSQPNQAPAPVKN